MKNKVLIRRAKIKKRVRSKIIRQSAFPRLSVHKTNIHIYAQVIDDFATKTLAHESDIKTDGKKMKKMEKAQEVGKKIAEKMKKQNIKQVVFDRGVYPYKGRIKALAEAVREAGITI